MKFASAIWKLLVGIKDALVLLLMLLFFGLLYAALSARPAPVGEGVLDFRLEGSIVEQPARRDWADVAGGNVVQQHRLRSLVDALDSARTDRRVKAVAIDVDALAGGGQTAMADLAEAVRRVRASGKPVLAYGIGYTDDTYQLAAAASEIWLNPLGAVVVAGPGGSNLYFKGLLDKLGVTANVYRAGTYKSAVEPFTRMDMSPEAERNALALDQALLETWRQHVRTSRPNADIDLFLRDMPGAVARAGGDMAQAALRARLVDKLGDRQAFERRLIELQGDNPARQGVKLEPIELSSYINATASESATASIGVVTVAGTIIDGEAGPGTAGGDTIAEAIERGIDEDVKALVVRIDSPGGSVLASERIRQALLAAKARNIPVVASMANVAASGGYWVATPASFIFAEPSTVTGSIGVFGVLPSFQGAIEKLGIGADGVKTTPLSGEPDLLKGPSPEVDQLIQTGVDAMYRRFLAIVAASRKKTPQQIDQIAQGRVWDGGSARQLGLVDGFGGIEEAVAKAAELARLGDDRSVRYLDPPQTLEDQLIEMIALEETEQMPAPDAFARFARRPQEQLAGAINSVRAILSGATIQARCLECGPVAPPPATSRTDRGLLALLLQWLA